MFLVSCLGVVWVFMNEGDSGKKSPSLHGGACFYDTGGVFRATKTNRRCNLTEPLCGFPHFLNVTDKQRNPSLERPIEDQVDMVRSKLGKLLIHHSDDEVCG